MAEMKEVGSGNESREPSTASPGRPGPDGAAPSESAKMAQQPARAAEAAAPPDAPTTHRGSPLRRVLVGALVAVACGAVGYMITPQHARSELQQTGTSLREAQRQLELVRNAGSTVTAELERTRSDLSQAKTELVRLEQTERDLTGQVGKSGEQIAALNGTIESRQSELAALEKDLCDARQTASRNEQTAGDARALATELEAKLSKLLEERDGLAQKQQRLLDEQARLAGELNEQKRLSTDLTRLLSVLEVGTTDRAPAPAPTTGEKPVTVKELRYWLGAPSVVAQKGSALRMHWGQKHTAEALDDVVTTIDGQPATRAMLSGLAAVEPVGDNVPWRLAKDEPVRYVDLLAMFGRPEGTTGTGDEFSAWWSVGAWARNATARIVNGIVTEFDGREVDADVLCELVRHRAEAYRTPNPSVATAAKACYDFAGKRLQDHLAREAELMARDGWTLKEWKLADFDSVGTWIAPTSTPANAMTLRAGVVCTWVAGDGRVTTQRRYLVVTLGTYESGTKTEDFALFAPRD